jgi:hypothetical protein
MIAEWPKSPPLQQPQGRSKWFSEPVHTVSGTITEIAAKIPLFERRPFVAAPRQGALFATAETQRTNRFRDLIVRTSFDSDESEVPVGVVSKNYGLIQHKEIFDAVSTALQKAGVELEKVRSILTLTEYKGRMRLSFVLPEKYNFDPGDGNPMALRLECFNSVDGSSRLWVVFGWLRFVCGNGLILGKTRLNLRRIHNGTVDITALSDSIQDALIVIHREQAQMKFWMGESVTAARLESFADSALKRKWGVRAAARFLLICMTGHDGSPKDPFQKAKPSELRMSEGCRVPGASAPVQNAFAASQALAWISLQRTDIQEQVERTRVIPALVAALLRQKN